MGAEESVPFLTRGNLCVINSTGRVVIVLDKETYSDSSVECGEYGKNTFAIHYVPIRNLTYITPELYPLYGIHEPFLFGELVKYARSSW